MKSIRLTIENLTRLKELITEQALASYWEGYYMYAPHNNAHSYHAIYKQKVGILGNFIDNILIELSKEVTPCTNSRTDSQR